MVEWGGRLVVIGGNVDDPDELPVNVPSTETLVPSTGVWTACKTPISVREAGVIVMDDKVYVIGGFDGEDSLSVRALVYSPGKKTLQVHENLFYQGIKPACCTMTIPEQYVT